MGGDATCDVVVVGGGIGGLVAAAYLAAAGRRVLLAEEHDLPGGSGLTFDIGAHYVGDCGPDGLLPAVLSGLGIRDRVAFRPMKTDGFDRIMLPGLRVDVPTGWGCYLARLQAAMPNEAAGIARCVRVLRSAAQAERDRLIGDPSMDAHQWRAETFGELIVDCGLSSRAATLLAAQSGTYGSAPSRTSVSTHATMLDRYLRGAYHPVGGSRMIAGALAEVIKSHGGVVRTRCRVGEIIVFDGRVQGVVLDGSFVSAPVVVSHAEDQRPATITSVGLDRPLDLPNANIWWWQSEDVEAAYAQVSEPPFAFLSFASATEGGFQIVTPVVADTESMVDLAERAIGPFRERITYLDTACRTGRRPDVPAGAEGLYVVERSSGVVGAAVAGIVTAGRILGRPLLPEAYAGLGKPRSERVLARLS